MSLLRSLLLVAVATLPCVLAIEYVHTPVGKMRADCVHKVPTHSTVREHPLTQRLEVFSEAGEYIRTIPKCENQEQFPLLEPKPHTHRPKKVLTEDEFKSAAGGRHLLQFPADYDGWTAYTAFHDADGIDTFLGNFSVPDAPATSPDILYIFTGLQNIDWIPKRDPNPDGFDIIQPVLQYPADEGTGWSLKSWYVTLDDGALNSDEILINSGDNCFGNMTQTGNSSWYIGSTVSSTGQTTVLNVDRPRLAGQFWAYNTLECYGCQDCTTYPQQPSKFTNLALSKSGIPIEPEWLLNPKPNPTLFCHETIDIIDPENQNIIFQ